MESTPATVKRTRSPAYPAISLPNAIEVLSVIFRSFQAHPAPIEAIGEALGMKAGGSALNGRVSALKKFDLLEELGEARDAKTYRVTKLAKDILLAPQGSIEHAEALRKAALMPVIYESLWTRFGPELPSDPLIRSHLVRERNFNAHQVDGMIADFRETIKFARLESKTPITGETSESTEQAVPPFASPAPQVARPVVPTLPAGEVFTIPLEDGKIAAIPYPMSRQTWDLFMQTLKLWEPRLVKNEEPSTE